MILFLVACKQPEPDGYLPISIDVADAFDHLVVTTVTGDIVIEHTDETFLSGQLIVIDDQDDYSLAIVAGVLTLAASCVNGEAGCSGAFFLSVPAGPSIDVITTAGDLTLDTVHDHVVTHSSTTGDVYGYDLGRSITVTAETTAGRHDVQFKHEPKALTLTAQTGNVEATVPAGLYAVEVISGGTDTVTGVTVDASGKLIRLSSQEGDVTLTGVFEEY